MLLHLVQRGQLAGIKLVPELDRLVWPCAAVRKADQALPYLAIAVVGLGLQADLDQLVPDTRLAEEGVDLDLVKLVDLAFADGMVGLVNQLLHARAKLY
jgi:hypothetical protein